MGLWFQVLFHSPHRGSFHLSLTVLLLYRSYIVFSLGSWSTRIPTGFLVSRRTQVPPTESPTFRLRGFHPLWQAFPNLSAIVKFYPNSAPCGTTALQPRHCWRFRLLRFRSPLLSESFLFSVPGVLRWFSSPSCASAHYFIHIRITVSLLLGYPIRLSTDQWVFAPPRRFSQLTTAFFANIRQGIHHKPLFA